MLKQTRLGALAFGDLYLSNVTTERAQHMDQSSLNMGSNSTISDINLDPGTSQNGKCVLSRECAKKVLVKPT